MLLPRWCESTHSWSVSDAPDPELSVLQKETDCAQHSLVQKNAHWHRAGLYDSGLVSSWNSKPQIVEEITYFILGRVSEAIRLSQ